MKNIAVLVALAAFAAPAALHAQARKRRAALPKEVQLRVDEAIRKGVLFLKKEGPRAGRLNRRRSDELVLWTLVHAGMPEKDPVVAAMLKTLLETELTWTYNVSLQAMILEELDRVTHQRRIAQCAQFLLDNQCANGQWGYGTPSPHVKDIPTFTNRKVATAGGRTTRRRSPSPALRRKPKVIRRVVVKKMREGPARGDNSNSQYAALGLRACHDAGIILPRDAAALAEKAWRDLRHDDGGWSYIHKNDGASYGAMTAGAAGALTIYLYIQNRPWMRDRDVVKGLEWMVKNFTVEKNPGYTGTDDGQGGWRYYYLYALERAAIFYGTERLGAHAWYPEGVKALLAEQRADGTWMSKGADHPIWDTCFALLFLRRATRPLIDVATVDRRR